MTQERLWKMKELQGTKIGVKSRKWLNEVGQEGRGLRAKTGKEEKGRRG